MACQPRSYMLFADACFGPGTEVFAGAGGVLLTGLGSAISYAALSVPEECCRFMSANDEATITCELETLGVQVGLAAVFRDYLKVRVRTLNPPSHFRG